MIPISIRRLNHKLVNTALTLSLLSISNVALTTELHHQQKYDQLKPVSDKRAFKTLTLENNLSILLISNPSRNKASATMDVGIGSLAEPKEFQGLAHFLEHLLFLGTSKYPEIDGYKKLIDMYQGSDNAYTSRENTNYHFSVNHEGFRQALDRFSWFFKDPSFHAEFVDKERKAVNDEASMLKSNDGWRQMILLSRLLNQDHPLHNYHPGDLETLKHIKRADVLDFYKNNYSASDMNLVLDSNFSLESMEAWVREYFSDVPDRGIKRQSYSRNIIDQKNLPLLVTMKPIQQERSLNLKFLISDQSQEWLSKPAHLISHFIGHEGEGSLLAKLKQENLATSLSAGMDEHSFANMLDINIDLTPDGLNRWNEVLDYFYSYIKMLQESGLPRNSWEEIKNISEIDYLFSDMNTSSGLNRAMFMATKMHRISPLSIEPRTTLIYSYQPEVYQKVLKEISSDHMIAFIANPDALLQEQEKDFGTPFELIPVSSLQTKSWTQPVSDKNFHLPNLNPYVADPDHMCISDATETTPEKIIDSEWGTFWYQKDDQTRLPKSVLKIQLVLPLPEDITRNEALTDLYLLHVKDKMNQWSYDLDVAGINLGLSGNRKGLVISLSGYSDHFSKVLADLPAYLSDATIDESKFSLYKLTLKEDYFNHFSEQPYKQLYTEMAGTLAPGSVFITDLIDPETNDSILDSVTLEEFQDFVNHLYKKVAIEGSYYGPLSAKSTGGAVSGLIEGLKSSPLSLDLRRKESELALDGSVNKTLKTKMENHCWGQVYQMGIRNPKTDAMIRIAMAFLEQHFFNSLRTEQKMGYVVNASRYYSENILGLMLLVQSSSHSPELIEKAKNLWLMEALKEFSTLSPEDFASYSQAVISELNREPQGLKELFSHVDTGAWRLKGDFDYGKKVATAASKLSQPEIHQYLTAHLLTKPKSLTIGYVSEKNND